MTHTRIAPPPGILTPDGGERRCDVRWHEPSTDLAFFVEGHWIVEWDLRGHPPLRSVLLTGPYVHVVYEPWGPSAYGVSTRTLSRVIAGTGRSLATRFRPAGFQPFSRSYMSDLTDRVVPLAEIFQMPDPAPDVLGAADDRAAIAVVEDVLRAQHPVRDPGAGLVNGIVDEILEDRMLTTVDGVAARFNTTPPTLQRMFARYVGVSPAWVIRRRRMPSGLRGVGGALRR